MTRLTAALFRTGFTATARGLSKAASIRSVAHQNSHLLSRRETRPLHLKPNDKMRIVPVPVREDKKTNSAAVVDPCEPKDIIKAAKAENVTLSGTILTTHHHEDHSGGNLELISFLQENDTSKDKVKVYGGSKKIPGLTNLVEHKSNFKLGLGEKAGENDGGGIEVSCLATPCHTGDSICYYYLQDSRQGGPGCVFTGGTPEEMDQALNQRLASLPDEMINVTCWTRVKYTKSNAVFAKSIEPKNQHLLSLIKACESKDLAGITTGKYTIGDEKKFNPFMRLEEPDVVSAVGLNSPSRVEVMTKLRELKNSFKA
ncbi:Cytoplasmic glyoxalase II [Puccinia graminis f. sp. tritici]|uniref:hydroxyacylglutathione hydrolase n=1 Tax=Puccinia graminis f. sp. tritici TaxID=56615 RepID=A0A5B0N8J6_PUCGR|nr:Cytoplasmic glyoxalase II [Puccinia graminis f. sp. tritici]